MNDGGAEHNKFPSEYGLSDFLRLILLQVLEFQENQKKNSQHKDKHKWNVFNNNRISSNRLVLSLDEAIRKVQKKLNNGSKSDELDKLQEDFEYFQEVAVKNMWEFDEFEKKEEVLELLGEITSETTSDELIEIDSKLTGFLLYNHQQFSEESVMYPDYLIEEGKRQLERMSRNYGGRLAKSNRKEDVEATDFPIGIFLKFENYRLFKYFIEHFGHTKRPIDLSQIHEWMLVKGMINPRMGKEFRAFTVDSNLVNRSFAKILKSKHNSQVILNSIYQKYLNEG